MALDQIKTPPERTDDLTAYDSIESVDGRLRDLPASYAIPESGWLLPEGKTIGQILEQYERPETDTQKKEAVALLSKIQLVLLNLMLHSSGYRNDEPVTSPVKEWDIRMLLGDRTQTTNFGNHHEVSRIPEDTGRLATPVSPGEGWLFRMVDFKENFIYILRSLRYFAPKDEGEYTESRAYNSDKAKWARKLIEQLMG